ncbi:MAG: polysaccharide biosynthesis/export family protein [Phycisphaeraceae bacterium]|nr:MAG: polysaccharide biosynthesis/export family protein [Phycisphaeraceae bacterium]
MNARRLVGPLFCVVAAAALPGCHWDSFFDPSVVGRWEETPTVVPILEQLAPIESDGGALVEYTDVTPEDLQVQAEEYTISAGDQIELTVYDVVAQGQPEVYQRTVDENGYLEVPQLGRVFVRGLTEDKATDLFKRRFGQFVSDPLVSVVIVGRRAQSFHLQGAVAGPGRYQIPSSDYRLLEALIAGGGVDPNLIDYVHVIRQVALSDTASPNQPESPAGTGEHGQTPLSEPGGENLIDIINDLTDDKDAEKKGDGGGGSPAVLEGGVGIALTAPEDQPEPLIDLVEPDTTPVVPNTIDRPAPAAGGGRWMFINGEWVRGYPQDDQRTKPGRGPAAVAGEAPLMTQRVIRIPVKPLLAGDARYNIIVRPGDVISVPNPEQGNVYLGGQFARPGVYQIPIVGRLTLTRAVTAAGGLSGLAIPERVDLTRMVGPDRQATIMLDLRAIEEGTQPDVFLKPDDHVNIGTNFWALPLAVVRNGFRTSYGFGFLLDRNFGNDVFGAPPTNITR